jgi:hypothetical protein
MVYMQSKMIGRAMAWMDVSGGQVLVCMHLQIADV